MAKVRAAKRLLLFGPDLVLQKSGELATSQSSACRVAKADEAKRIVYSIVLDPYQIDAQGDWIPPNEIEDTAHQFLVRSRVIGYRHQKRANASVVESAVEPYPPEQYELAMKNEAHSAYRRPFGGDKIHSGSWFIGIKLDEPLWKEYLAGKIDAVSIGGEGVRTDIDTTSMPEVTFIDLEAKEPIEQ